MFPCLLVETVHQLSKTILLKLHLSDVYRAFKSQVLNFYYEMTAPIYHFIIITLSAVFFFS